MHTPADCNGTCRQAEDPFFKAKKASDKLRDAYLAKVSELHVLQDKEATASQIKSENADVDTSVRLVCDLSVSEGMMCFCCVEALSLD